jgi:hypothetical protein
VVESLQANGGNSTVLIDADALSGVTSLSGSSLARFVTEETTLDLSGKAVSSVWVESANATGTTFTVNSKSTAFQVRGGAGNDTLSGTSLVFTAAERDFIFDNSVETITDGSGTYSAPGRPLPRATRRPSSRDRAPRT